MAKKMVSGVLCKDRRNKIMDRPIVFFGTSRAHVQLLGSMYWTAAPFKTRPRTVRQWTAEDFAEEYDLRDENGKPCKPPRAGTAFEVDLEL